MNTKHYFRIIKAFCIYDILALLPMALPFINLEHIATLSKINEMLGGNNFAEFTSLHLMFVQMLGLLGAAWAIWRWKFINIQIARYEGGLRFLFSITLFQCYLSTSHPILLVFAIIDLIAALLHFSPIHNKVSEHKGFVSP